MITSRGWISDILVWGLVITIPAVGAQSGRGPSKETNRKADERRSELLSNLVEIKDSPAECYDLLKRRLLEGHFDDVKAGLDLRDDRGRRIFGDYRFAQLRALCARATFLRYNYHTAPLGWPSEKEGQRLRQLATEATAAYEEAYRLAPTDFERACVYARWHEIHTRGRFEADSLLLRSGSPLEYQDKAVDEVLSSQASRLRSTAARALDSANEGKPLGADSKAAFLDVLTDEYRKLGRIGVPEGVFREVLNDLPEFLQKGIHRSVLIEPKAKRIMIRYHLWYALTGPRPDEIDDEFISRQVQTVDKWIRERFAKELSARDADEASAIFLNCVNFVRENCFLPRLQRPVWPFEWSEPKNEYEKNTEDDIRERIDQTVARIVKDWNRQMSRRRSLGNVQEEFRQRTEMTIKSMTAGLLSELTRFQRFSHLRHPPGAIFREGSGGGIAGFWVFQTDKYAPVPPYPWKKRITPVDSCTASTRQIASRALQALGRDDTATLDTLLSESTGFSKQDLHELTATLKDKIYASTPERMQEIEDLLIEKPWSWSAVRVRPPTEGAEKTLALIFQWKHRAYWLAWAGLVEGGEKASLADRLAQLKPGLMLPSTPEPVEIAEPVGLVSVDDISEMQSLEPIDAGHSWRVRLALADGDAAPWKLLYCRAEWTDQDRPARPVPFGGYIARHLGPVIWTISKDGFRETGPDLNSRPAPPMSIGGNGSVYAATLPLSGFEQAYLQVYSAFDGRELARRCITADDSSAWPWGQFMTHQKSQPFGVSADFDAACPGMPAFKPQPTKTTDSGGPSISLSLKDGFFSLKSDKRILPTRGSRLLARWWLNGEPVSPKPGGGFTVADSPRTEGLAGLLRLPAKLPTAVLKARPGDEVGLQVMLSPDRIESPALNPDSSQCIASLDIRESPTVPILSNRLDFKVDAGMIVPRSSTPATAANLKKLVDAIRKGNTRTVRRLVSECPQLARALDTSGRSALEITCRERPRARYLGPWKIGGDADARHWKERAEIAEILIDYGADVNAETGMRQTPLHTLVDPLFSFRPDDMPPVELVRTLLNRGANPELGGHRGTDLQQAVRPLRSGESRFMGPIVKMLLEYDADVFAVREPWAREPVYDLVDELTEKGHADVAALVRKHGAFRRKELSLSVRAGVEEFLERVRNADEKALLSLSRELPWMVGIELPRLGRSLQNEYGPDLKGIRSISRLYLSGDWAEVTLPTGREGEKANVRIVLMRYPGGAYHAVEAGWTDGSHLGSRIRDASTHHRGLMNAVYSAFGWMHKCEVSGGLSSTGYPSRIPLISIRSERGRLIVRGRNVPSWTYFHAELTPALAWYWDHVWSLRLASTMTFTRDGRTMAMAGGSLTLQNKDKTIVFTKSDGHVLMETGGEEILGDEFVLNLTTLEVER
jgi:hypothetical protein